MGVFYSKIIDWLVRLIEAQMLWRTRPVLRDPRLPSDQKEEMSRRFRDMLLPRIINPSIKILSDMLHSVIRLILPEGYSFSVSEHVPDQSIPPVIHKLSLVDGSVHKNCDEVISHVLDENPENWSKDRLHEVEAVQAVLRGCRSDNLIVSIQKLLIRNEDHITVDEWDGVILEVDNGGIRLSIIEAKNTRPVASRSKRAYDQLKETMDMLALPAGVFKRRLKVDNFGARLLIRM